MLLKNSEKNALDFSLMFPRNNAAFFCIIFLLFFRQWNNVCKLYSMRDVFKQKKIKHTSHQLNDDESSPNCIKYLSIFSQYTRAYDERNIYQSLWLPNLSGHKESLYAAHFLCKKKGFFISTHFSSHRPLLTGLVITLDR